MQIRKEKSYPEEEFILEGFMESDENWHPYNKDENEIVIQELNKCLEELNNEQKTSVKEFYYSKKSYAELAESMKIDIKKVKSLLQNGKRNLKNCMDKKADS